MKRYANMPLVIILVLAAILIPALTSPANASEGAWSSYTPGTYGDFSLNYAEPGLYFRENVIFVTGEIDDYPLVAPTVNAKIEQDTWFNLLNIAYVTEKKILGAHYFWNMAIPYGFSAEVDLEVAGQTLDDSTSGLGDIQISPIGLMWNSGYFHITLAENVVLKTGEYNAADLANMGRNYNSYETLFGMTWLHEKRGHEISFLAGYMLNEKNQATDYRTGDEFHVDATVAQYFSDSFGVALVGYYYKQMTDDEGPLLDTINEINGLLSLPTPGGYKSEAAGFGPAIMWSPAKNLQLYAKWIHDAHADNHIGGDWGHLSACMKF
jgi:hypothetical protein